MPSTVIATATSTVEGARLPLVLVLHGGGGNAANAERMTGFTAVARSEGFIVVYPEGTWYAGLDIPKLDRVIDEHLIGGRPVEELVFAVGDLS